MRSRKQEIRALELRLRQLRGDVISKAIDVELALELFLFDYKVKNKTLLELSQCGFDDKIILLKEPLMTKHPHVSDLITSLKKVYKIRNDLAHARLVLDHFDPSTIYLSNPQKNNGKEFGVTKEYTKKFENAFNDSYTWLKQDRVIVRQHKREINI